jgi:hypothetical protein
MVHRAPYFKRRHERGALTYARRQVRSIKFVETLSSAAGLTFISFSFFYSGQD